MVAIVTTKMYTEASPVSSDLPGGNLRFSTSDEVDPGNNFPIPIPNSGSYYSYWRTIVFYVTQAPDTSITSIYLYTDGNLGWGTGVDVYIGGQYPDTYVQATGTQGVTGLNMVGNYSGISGRTNLFTYNSGNLCGPIPQIATSGTGRYTKFVVLQLETVSGATSGAKTPETVTWKFNEV